jgi:hypothetical protein
MRIRVSVQGTGLARGWCLTIVFVTFMSIASPTLGSSIGILPEPDIILLFRPQDDHVLSVVEEVVRGDILRVEKGAAPRLIVTPAGTLGPWWQAGVPIRLWLMKFADRDAYYPVFTEPAPPVPKPPAIAISATDGFVTVQTTPRGSPIVLEAKLTIPDPGSARLDVYLGVVPPGGELLSWVRGQFDFPRLTANAAPVPYLVNFPVSSFTYRVLYRAPAADAEGWHTLYGLVVPPGADPLDPQRWISSSFYPFLVTAPGPETKEKVDR